MLFAATVDTERAYTFAEARKLAFKRTVLETIGWRLQDRVVQLLGEVQANLAHPYKHVRDQLGLATHEVPPAAPSQRLAC